MGGGASHSKTNIVDKTPEEFEALRGPLADYLSSAISDLGLFTSGAGGFNGSSINLNNYRAPMTTEERSALAGLRNLTAPSSTDILGQELIDKTLRGDFLRRESNPYLEDLIRYATKNVQNAYDERSIANRDLFATAGQRVSASSPFAESARKLEEEKASQIGQMVSELAYGNLQAERDRQVQAIEQARANAGFEFERQLEYFQASSLPRLIDEIGFDRAFTEFQSRLAMLSQALGITAQVTAPVLGTEGTSSSAQGGVAYSGGGGGGDTET